MTQVRNRRPTSPRQAAACCRPIDDRLDPELFKALSDPTRVLLLACLAKCGRPSTVSEVAECCAVDLSVVSRHLAQLADAGVLDARKEGRTVWYRVRYEEISQRLRALADAIEACAPLPARRPAGGTGCCLKTR
ncbi:MAG: winged helix-turn-helix domain-containing protein [Phycisphaerae bacterium]|nr:MAG: ArsR family transcriptional regulator [Planctomycetota bacterium]KAB2939912.1 MAG: winged helix-turn-helix transcriptional regulator [Phycisphaerae bacterium]MBE7455129.1 winged helix-turn-helix transcriptional regulator [Planctomycetia bacterium]MCK6466442.1 metalloregulator ArsR/SmtB family transcription factor [Phycisphaerae bacterium]MCL4720227.1 winged helix-turn-helix domain-containing protein [Phycisphaerae bacterium]